MSSNLKVNTILPSTGTTIGIGTVGGLINVVGNIDVNSTSGISTFNGLEISGIVTAKAGAAVTYYGDGSNLTGITDNVVTINNNASTKFITGSGSANTLDCEANLSYNNSLVTFSSSNFLVDKGTNPTITAKETAGNKEVQLRANTTGGLLRTAGSYPLVLGTNQTERLRIDSAGRVGIKNTNMSSFNTGMDDLVIGNGVSNTSPGMTIFSHATDIGTISFRDSADTGISGLIQYRHLESPPYMKFMVEGTQRMSITTHGGIAFNSDTAAANTLDDYEEGSWTPTFNSNSNGGTFPVSTYIRIGRLVSISFHATVGGGNDTSGFKVFGLPFSPDKNGVAPVSTNCNIPCHCRIFDSSNRMEVHKFDSSDVTYQNLSDKFIMINATYRCNP